MVFIFFALWVFGAALLLTCTALVWSDRISVLRTRPMCADCGYDLTGLARTAKCPECAGTWRKFTAGRELRVPASKSVMLWVIPLFVGLVGSGMLAAGAKIPAPGNVLGAAANALPFLFAGVLVRMMLPWMTLSAATTIMWCATLVMGATLAGVMADAVAWKDLETTAQETWPIAPLMVAPFAGYGIAFGILILAWQRSRPVRPPDR